jgi:hypothetical protein
VVEDVRKITQKARNEKQRMEVLPVVDIDEGSRRRIAEHASVCWDIVSIVNRVASACIEETWARWKGPAARESGHLLP